MEKFWEWLFKKAKSKVRERHLKSVGNDIKCPTCKEWFSVSGVEHNHKFDRQDFGYSTECGKCGGLSYWNCEAAPIPLRCDEVGTPLSS